MMYRKSVISLNSLNLFGYICVCVFFCGFILYLGICIVFWYHSMTYNKTSVQLDKGLRSFKIVNEDRNPIAHQGIPLIREIMPSYRLDGHVTIVVGQHDNLTETVGQALLAQGSQVALVGKDYEELYRLKLKLQRFCHVNKMSGMLITTWLCEHYSDKVKVHNLVNNITTRHRDTVPDKLVQIEWENINDSADQNLLELSAALVNQLSYSCRPFITASKTKYGKSSMGAASFIIIGPIAKSADGKVTSDDVSIDKQIKEWDQKTQSLFDYRINRIIPKFMTHGNRDIIGAVLYLLSDNASRSTNCSNIVVDGSKSE